MSEKTASPPPGDFSSGASLAAQLVKNLPDMQESLIQFLGREDPLGKGPTTLDRREYQVSERVCSSFRS